MEKELWFDARNLGSEVQNIVTDAINRNYTVIILNENDLEKIHTSEKTKKAVYVSKKKDIEKFSNADLLITDNIVVADEIHKAGKEVALHMQVDNRESMEMAANIDIDIQYLIVQFKDTTNIPLELILAKSQYHDIKVLKYVTDISDASIAMAVMECGSDGVVLNSNSIEEISLLSEAVKKRAKGKIKLVPCEIVEIKHLEMGARACIDTTSLLSEREGMIVGCTSGGGLLICSEVHYLPYMETRPFRVNAGTISSYIWAPDDKTEYIANLEAGSKVMVVDLDGNTRVVNVARVKTEFRPLILIKAKYQEQIINCIMQDDWHMRVYSSEGKVVNITDLKDGDLVLGYVCESGRHVGIKIDETIIES